jgi:peptidoglycan/xylan/chitin deacetylase (PgdA/CDA1 family)
MEVGRVLNLTFHGVGRPLRTLDPGESALWLDTHEFSEVVARVAGREDVAVSFDDGNASDAEVALEILRRHGVKATFFVVAERIGRAGFLHGDQLRELAGAGMGIGYHGRRHRPWRGLSGDELRRDLDAKAVLEDEAGRAVTHAACPFGAYDRRVLRDLRAAGFERVLTSDGGWAHSSSWLQPRNTLKSGCASVNLGSLARGPRRDPVGSVKLLVKRWR